MSTSATIPLPSAGYMANCRWIEAEWSNLLRDCPDQWIAVDQQRLLAAGRDLGRVKEEADRASASPDVVYEFVAGAAMIL